MNPVCATQMAPPIRWGRFIFRKIDEACIGVFAGYPLLRRLGSSHSTTAGEEIQVGGQKIIAYTAVLAVFARSLLVRSHIRQLVPAFTT